jgi:dihydrofolate synthase/folylpolyglutamate synthase
VNARFLSQFQKAEQYLYSLRNQGFKYELEAFRNWMQLQGNPHLKFPCIHVAGTNGKGSVCAMLESIYRTAGYKTGLYTSPHLVYLGERIQVNRIPIPVPKLIHFIESTRKRIEATSKNLSFFEQMTAIAFEYFAQESVDIAIIETGLGGLLDATNIVKPELSIITSIGKDHTHLLGTTIESIATQKGGIIKPKCPVILGKLPYAADQVLRKLAADQSAPVYSVCETYGTAIEAYPKTALIGDLQRINAGTAALACQILSKRFPVNPYIIEEGLRSVKWSGRWETLSLRGDTKLILDATHNADGVPMLKDNLAHLYKQHLKKPIILIGVLGSERAEALIPCVAKFAETIILVKVNQPRALEPSALRTFIPSNFEGTVIESELKHLFAHPLSPIFSQTIRPIVVTGSIYLLGEVLSLVKPITYNQSQLQDYV